MTAAQREGPTLNTNGLTMAAHYNIHSQYTEYTESNNQHRHMGTDVHKCNKTKHNAGQERCIVHQAKKRNHALVTTNVANCKADEHRLK